MYDPIILCSCRLEYLKSLVIYETLCRFLAPQFEGGEASTGKQTPSALNADGVIFRE